MDIPCEEVCNEIPAAVEIQATADTSTQTPHIIKDSIGVEHYNMETQHTTPPLSYDTMDNRMISYHTGLECKEKFQLVLQSLGKAAYELNYYVPHEVPSISIDNQLLITLIKLRLSKANIELSMLFGIPARAVSNIFYTWVNFMYYQWGEVDWWPSQETVRYYAPDGFKRSYPNTRVIIDGTECPLAKPSKPLAQQVTWSSYKNRNTVKVLVGATPGGLISYVSESYGGAASDRQIVERSNLTTMCDPGDEIMSDKGFNVEDLFIPKQVMVNIPTFFKQKNRMDGKTVRKDRHIASKRVHIERLIGLVKTYAILRTPMNDIEGHLYLLRY